MLSWCAPAVVIHGITGLYNGNKQTSCQANCSHSVSQRVLIVSCCGLRSQPGLGTVCTKTQSLQ